MWYPPGEAPGAIPNGTRIMLVNRQKGDFLPDGWDGTVLASHNVEAEPTLTPGHDVVYWCEFPHVGGWVPGISGRRIVRVDG